MSCSTISSLVSNTKSSEYFSVNDLSYFDVSKSFQSFLDKVSLYKLNETGDKQQPCLTPLPKSNVRKRESFLTRTEEDQGKCAKTLRESKFGLKRFV
jgi:hypothetical protein